MNKSSFLAEKLQQVRDIGVELGVGDRGTERILAGLESMAKPSPAEGQGGVVSHTMRLPGLRAMPLWDAEREQFPEVAGLERNFQTILAEFRSLRDAGALRRYSDGGLVAGGSWGQFHLRVRNMAIEENISRCPVTSALVLTGPPYVGVSYFSVHAPGTRVHGHFGPANYRIRCHLGIEIPDDCGMRVGGQVFRWKVGRCTLLDDSFYHEVWNDGASARAILLTDLWHPDLRPEEIQVFARLSREPGEHTNDLRRLLLATHEDPIAPAVWGGRAGVD